MQQINLSIIIKGAQGNSMLKKLLMGLTFCTTILCSFFSLRGLEKASETSALLPRKNSADKLFAARGADNSQIVIEVSNVYPLVQEYHNSRCFFELLPGSLRYALLKKTGFNVVSAQALLERPVNFSTDEQKDLADQAMGLGAEGYNALIKVLPAHARKYIDKKNRIGNLLTAINRRESDLVDQLLRNELQWADELYKVLKLQNGWPSLPAFQEAQRKRLVTQTILASVDESIEKENARLKRLKIIKKLSGDPCSCGFLRIGNLVLTGASIFTFFIWSMINLPDAFNFWDCANTNFNLCFDTESAPPNDPCNSTLSQWPLFNCCNNQSQAICKVQMDHYNSKIYPKEVTLSMMPLAIGVPAVLLLQVAIQSGGYYYRRSLRNLNQTREIVENHKAQWAGKETALLQGMLSLAQEV